VDASLRAFDAWMSGGGPWNMVLVSATLLIALPFLILVHELAHAAVGLLTTKGLVRIRVGQAPGWIRGRIGRLAFDLSLRPVRADTAGLATTYAPVSARVRLAYALAGPLANGALAVALIATTGSSTGTGRFVLGFVTCLNLALFAGNLVPGTRHGRDSDGRIALSALRAIRRGEPRTPTEFDETWSRWFALITDDKIRTPERAQLLGRVPAALGFNGGPNDPTALGLWRLALAGWCWRECAGDADDERAFGALPDGLRVPGLPEDRQHSAFRHGIVLHREEQAA